MSSFLSLIRFPNLLIIAFTQYMMRYAVLQPIIRFYGFDFQMSSFTFFCLTLSTMCTAAAGYAINDYFDIKTDNINRPDEVIVGRNISRRKTVMIHIILSAAGILLGGYVTWRAGIPSLVFLYIFITGMLWLYSTTYKRQLLIGNLLVSLFTALVPLMVLLDIPPLNRTYYHQLIESGINFNLAIFWVLGFSVFAFLTTLSREIIKDAEDFEGDSAFGCHSIPITWGIEKTKMIIIGINTVIVGLLAFIYCKYLHYMLVHHFNYISFFYILVLVILPMIWLSWLVFKAKESQDYRRAGNLLKLVMLSGILFGIFIRYSLL